MKYLPNALSCCRVIFSFLLLYAERSGPVFMLLYVACGVTDLADGFIARRFNSVSAAGARLDSLADLIFSFIVLSILCSQQWQIPNHMLMVFVFAILMGRLLNMLITAIKFRQWNVIHTIGNKAAGIALFSILPIQFLFGRVPILAIVIVMVLALYSSIEETCILLLSTSYDVNRKSLMRYY